MNGWLKNNTLPILIVFLGCLFFVFYKRKESLTNTNDDKDKLAQDILDFIKEDTEYKDYLDYVVKIPYNLSMKINEQSVFFELRFMAKNNILTKDKIKEYITDM